MSKRFEIFVAMVDRIGKSGFNAGAAAAVHDQFNTDNQGFSLVVQTAQTSSAIASVLSVTQMTAGAVPFLNIVTNTQRDTGEHACGQRGPPPVAQTPLPRPPRCLQG